MVKIRADLSILDPSGSMDRYVRIEFQEDMFYYQDATRQIYSLLKRDYLPLHGTFYRGVDFCNGEGIPLRLHPEEGQVKYVYIFI